MSLSQFLSASPASLNSDERTTNMTDLHEGLRAWARGVFPLEAGVELLIHDGRAVYAGAPWLQAAGDLVSVDVDQLLDETGAWSSGERRLVAIAASLLSSDHPVDLNDAVSGLDRSSTTLVLAALAHANGSHEHGGFEFDASGKPTRIIRHESLYPWPAAPASADAQ